MQKSKRSGLKVQGESGGGSEREGPPYHVRVTSAVAHVGGHGNMSLATCRVNSPTSC